MVRLGRRAKVPTKRGVQRLLWLALATIGFLTRRKSSEPRLVAGNSAIRRILVIRLDLLGDVVLSLPAVRALHRAYPAAQIDMLVLAGNSSLVKGDPDITTVYSYDPSPWRRPHTAVSPRTWYTGWSLIKSLRARQYDLVLSVSGDIASIITKLAGGRRQVGYEKEAYPFFLSDPVPGGRYRTRMHEVEYVLRLARAAGGLVEPGDELLKLWVDPSAAERIGQRLRDARRALNRHGPVVAIHPGARNGHAKRWPVGHIADLANHLSHDLDAVIVLTGTPGDAPIVNAVTSNIHEPVFDLTGQTSIPELVALLDACDVVVSGDSGPMHMACAVRTPVVALHGPTDPAISGPVAPDAIVMRQPIWCSPCYDASATAECRFDNPVCMKAIMPRMAYAAVKRQLARQDTTHEQEAETITHTSTQVHP